MADNYQQKIRPVNRLVRNPGVFFISIKLISNVRIIKNRFSKVSIFFILLYVTKTTTEIKCGVYEQLLLFVCA